MAEINVDNMDKNAELFMEKMGFAHDSEGLELSEEQLVNFLLLCHQMEYGVGEEEEEHEDDGVKVKIMKVVFKSSARISLKIYPISIWYSRKTLREIFIPS